MPRAPVSENESFQGEAESLRTDIHNAYAFVEGQRFTQSFASFTVEEAMDAYVERLSGKDTPVRPNVINRTKAVAARVAAAVEKIKAMPADAFRAADPATDVNTPVEGYGTA